MKIAYLILAHDESTNLKTLVNRLINDDLDCEVFIHYDKKSSKEIYLNIKTSFMDIKRVHVLENRIKCGWGEFSLVEATLHLIKEAKKIEFDYCFLLSASCFPIRSSHALKNFLLLPKNINKSFIECNASDWILAGMRDDRYKYHHIFNFIKWPNVFRWFYRIQRYLKLVRKMPNDIREIKFGSQWWCLNKITIDKILEYLTDNQQYESFFRTVWIPDECFFQTLVWHMDKKNIISHSLTFYQFDDSGKPLVFHNNQQLKSLYLNEKFFVRKVSETFIKKRRNP